MKSRSPLMEFQDGSVRDVLTHPGPAHQQLPSQWGRVTLGRWCELEAARMNACGRAVEVLSLAAGEVCIAKRAERKN